MIFWQFLIDMIIITYHAIPHAGLTGVSITCVGVLGDITFTASNDTIYAWIRGQKV